jgi:diguanylate cyclase (GGDEF)-like protein
MSAGVRRTDDRLWPVFLLAGLAVTAGALALPRPWSEWVLAAVEAGGGVAVLAGVRRYRPEGALFWKLLAGGLFCFGGTHLNGLRGPAPLLDQMLLSAAFLLLTAAMVLRVRACSEPGHHRATLVDGAMVVLAVMAGSWSQVIGPMLAERWHNPTPAAIFCLYTLMALLRVAAAAVLLLAGNPRDRAHQLIVAGTFVAFTADTLYATSDRPPTVWHILGWVLGHLTIAAAALHPSMARAERGGDQQAVSRARLGLFATLTALHPLMNGPASAPGREEPPGGIALPMLFGIGVSVLLVLRMGMLGNLAERRARALDAALREQEALRAELEHRATHDPLTGLGNRAAVTEALGVAVGRPAGERGWLVLLDLDGFKEVNDTLGHPVGDELLVALGREFRRTAPDGLVARLGGDEFAVILPDAEPAAVLDTADALLHAAGLDHLLGGNRVRVSASIGVLRLDDVHSCAEALREADVALYAAKAAGRACYRIHAPENDRARNRAATGAG